MSLYFLLLLASGGIPVLLSFDKRLRFYKQWKYVMPSIFIVAGLYIVFDVWFTKQGHWGFNSQYLSGINLFGLPLEECLFFVIIPYASIFLHESVLEYFPQLKINKKTSIVLVLILAVVSLIIAIMNTDRAYTFYILMKTATVLLLVLMTRSEVLCSFFITFLVILIPFMIVNGILTGSFIENEVVWYNNNENLGLRFFTIPVEDFAYAFSMLLFNLLIIEKLKNLY